MTEDEMKFLSNKLRTFIEARRSAREATSTRQFLSNKLRTFIEAWTSSRISGSTRAFLSNKLRTFIEAAKDLSELVNAPDS